MVYLESELKETSRLIDSDLNSLCWVFLQDYGQKNIEKLKIILSSEKDVTRDALLRTHRNVTMLYAGLWLIIYEQLKEWELNKNEMLSQRNSPIAMV